jgi:hypothetical protein
VSDDVIYRDIEKLTKGRIVISDTTRLSVGNYSNNGQNRQKRLPQQRRRITNK